MLRSLYAGVSGMKSNQTKMDVIGNNISNVNTTGFKTGRVSFQDLFSQTVSSAQSPTNSTGGVNAIQVGLGVSIATIGNIMTGGSIQSTGRDLDVAVEGQGFLVVSPDGGTTDLYTRDGTLYKDKEGNLVTASGMKLQGYVVGQKANQVTDSIPYFLSPAIHPAMLAATPSLASLSHGPVLGGVVNNNGTVADLTDDYRNIDFNGISADGPAGVNEEARVYEVDTNGDGTVDRYNVSIDDDATIEQIYKVVDFDSNATTIEYAVDNDADGAIDYYTLQDGTRKYYGFDSNMDGIVDYYAADFKDGAGAPGTDGTFDTYAIDDDGDGKIDYHMTDTGNGVYAIDTTKDGVKEYDLITVSDSAGNFEYYGIDSNSDGKVNTRQIDEDGDGRIDYYTVDQDDDGKIDYRYYPIDENNDGIIDYYNKDINQDSIVDYFPADVNNDGNYDYYASQNPADISETVRGNLVVPQFIGGHKVEEVSIDGNGYVKAIYNGEIYYLGKLALAKFSNPEGLEKMGNNTYSKSSNSGEPAYGSSGVNGMGKIRTGCLEMSNVDLATEFTEMIITSRAYSANSKIITTSDEMLQELIGLKR